MRHLPAFLVVAVLPLVTSRPGMLSWVCRSCANANVVSTAQARILSPDGGEVGLLRLLQSIPRDQNEGSLAGPVMIDTVDNRVRLEKMKTFSFEVEIRAGRCDSLGEVVAGQFCSGCTNSLGVAIINNKDGQRIKLADIVESHSVVFFDKKNHQTKLGCGEITVEN